MTPSPALQNDIRRVIILGHSGFIGSHLERFFSDQLPDLEVVGRSFPTLDLTQEEDTFSLAPLFDLQTAVIVCSAIKRQLGDTLDAFSQNLKMVANLCRLLEQHPVKRLIYFSSAAVYGEDIHNTNITEATPVHPTSYYGGAKYSSEFLLRKQFSTQENSSLVLVRPATIYGPGDSGSAYSPSGFGRVALQQETITLWGDGTELREFLFIEDVVQLIYRLTFNEFDGVLNLVSGKSYSFMDILDSISNILDRELQINTRSRTKNKVDNCFDNTALRTLFPNFEFTNLETGIQKTLNYQKTQLQEQVTTGEKG
ncbi:NAD(P)-dependent oxidoreductase [Lusitaniella coriacea LEGE 07157]|uniref:NAD(P)-dependent oxidoreductase n=1 Tax=Lusitaniella coriacea LEGE 07157 TaxID=945747 RepID=A0A8J7DX42_9CYAN|nr:NAD(P)-dependent oxidoreductase [Lusitaniella coriacea]MBE9116859.1 NAD(P)-dependent oxidoreductase [Lusitaniella coriacea LEGE 07157]